MRKKATPAEIRREAEAALRKLGADNKEWWRGTSLGQSAKESKPLPAPTTRPTELDQSPIFVGVSFDLPTISEPAISEPDVPQDRPVEVEAPEQPRTPSQETLEARQAKPPKVESRPLDAESAVSQVKRAVDQEIKPSKPARANAPKESTPRQPKTQQQKKEKQPAPRPAKRSPVPNQAVVRDKPVPQSGFMSISQTLPGGDTIDVDFSGLDKIDMKTMTEEELASSQEAFFEVVVDVNEKMVNILNMLQLRMRMIESIVDRMESK